MIATRSRRANPVFVDNVEQFRADYEAMRESLHVRKRLGLAANGGGADYHIRNETGYMKLMEKARDLVRNDGIIGKTVERSALNIVGKEFLPAPDTGDKGLDTDLFDRWQEWASDPDLCDVQCEHTFHEQLQLVMQHVLTDGDIITLGTDSGALEVNEAHLCRNPQGYRKSAPGCVIGVEIDDRRKRQMYHLRRETTNPMRLSWSKESTAYPVRDKNGIRQVFHTWVPGRFTATRGVTALAPVFYIAQLFEDINFAKAVQQQLASFFAVWRKKAADPMGGMGGLPFGATPYGSQTTETNEDGTTKILESLEPGQEIPTEPGEEIMPFSPNIPNAEYFDHAKLLLTLIGINLGQPFVMMMMDASESNFSGWRAALEEARRGFQRNQRALITRHCSPIWRWRTAWLIANDSTIAKFASRSDIKINRHKFRPPAWPYIDPTADAAAQLLRMRNGLSSPRRIHGELSQDWEEIAVETIADNAFAIEKAIERAKEINDKHFKGEAIVHWRELLTLPTPDGVSVSISAGSQQSQSGGGGKNASSKPRR